MIKIGNWLDVILSLQNKRAEKSRTKKPRTRIPKHQVKQLSVLPINRPMLGMYRLLNKLAFPHIGSFRFQLIVTYVMYSNTSDMHGI